MNTVSSEVFKTIGEILRRAFPQLQSNANVNSSPSGAGQPVSGVMGFIGNLFTSPGYLGFSAAVGREAQHCVVHW